MRVERGQEFVFGGYTQGTKPSTRSRSASTSTENCSTQRFQAACSRESMAGAKRVRSSSIGGDSSPYRKRFRRAASSDTETSSSRNRFNEFPPRCASRGTRNVSIYRWCRADLTHFLHSSEPQFFASSPMFAVCVEEDHRTLPATSHRITHRHVGGNVQYVSLILCASEHCASWIGDSDDPPTSKTRNSHRSLA